MHIRPDFHPRMNCNLDHIINIHPTKEWKPQVTALYSLA